MNWIDGSAQVGISFLHLAASWNHWALYWAEFLKTNLATYAARYFSEKMPKRSFLRPDNLENQTRQTSKWIGKEKQKEPGERKKGKRL